MDQKQQMHSISEQFGMNRQPVQGRQSEPREVAPGIPVVRESTPRPMTWSSLMAAAEASQSRSESIPQFPSSAPSAPPLPEELVEDESEQNITTTDEVMLPSPSRPKEPEYQQSKLLPIDASAQQEPPIMEQPIPHTQPIEQNTEPIPALQEKKVVFITPLPPIQPARQQSQSWLIAFALYLVFFLLSVLTFAVLQGLGFANAQLSNNFLLLGVPWLVLIYGLLGGCVSSIVSLGRLHTTRPPLFVIITWFTRPFIGAILALLTYHLLSSGLFTARMVGTRPTLFLLAGALAGMCEGWIFARPQRP